MAEIKDDLQRLASTIRLLKNQGRKAAVFLGAGASKSAGIPLAEEIVDDICKREGYCDLFTESEKTYSAYMKCMPPGVRQRLFEEYTLNSKINLSHLYLASLVKAGYVECIVTTNFDPLAVKALALFNIFPAIYDIATSKDIIPAAMVFPAVIYLHGQGSGFWQLNTKDEIALPVESVRSVIEYITSSHVWIIVGYSGNDPVFKQLTKIAKYQEGLYWIGFKESDPEKHIIEQLLNIPTKNAILIRGYDSDSFFRSLHNLLKVKEPNIISKPFTQLLETINEFPEQFEFDGKQFDLFNQTRERLYDAIDVFELNKDFEETKMYKGKTLIEKGNLINLTRDIWLNQKYNDIYKYFNKIFKSDIEEAKKYLSFALFDYGFELSKTAKLKENKDEKKKLIWESIEKYKDSLKLKPDYEFPLNNLGAKFYELADLTEDQNEKKKLILESIAKYKETLKVNPNYESPVYNWGMGLWALSELTADKDEKKKLSLESIEKFKEALKIKPGDDLPLNNLGIRLSELAKLTDDKEEKKKLLLESLEKYKASIRIVDAISLNNWGSRLSDLANLSIDKKEKKKLLLQSIEKYKESLKINPNYYLAFSNWGHSLSELAAFTKNIDKKQKLYEDSIEKYNFTLKLNPDFDIALSNKKDIENKLKKILDETMKK